MEGQRKIERACPRFICDAERSEASIMASPAHGALQTAKQPNDAFAAIRHQGARNTLLDPSLRSG
jgi:hypothetical protein